MPHTVEWAPDRRLENAEYCIVVFSIQHSEKKVKGLESSTKFYFLLSKHKHTVLPVQDSRQCFPRCISCMKITVMRTSTSRIFKKYRVDIFTPTGREFQLG